MGYKYNSADVKLLHVYTLFKVSSQLHCKNTVGIRY